MAEGWANHLGGEDLDAHSAGIEAHGKNPRAIRVMREAGVDISHQDSTRLIPDMLQWAELVVTVCGHADERCPVLPPGTKKEHWALEDPAKATGTDAQVMAVFRSSRDDIKARVQNLIARIRAEPSSAMKRPV